MRVSAAVLTWVVLMFSSGVLADGCEDSTVINFNDGPHIYWHNDSLATILYYCNESVDSQTVTVVDTLRFNGFCGDSLTEYVIYAEEIESEPCTIADVSKIIAVSDIHGEYEYLASILINSGVIDSSLQWIWGDGHLVIDGDIFDRGDMVTECLWLIYHLEQQAEVAGGGVHFVLGNHELMVIRGDNRYVHDKYLKGVCRKTRIKHEDLFGPDMELGRWLRSKPTLLRINDILFVHGGISPDLINRGLTMANINTEVRRGLDLRSSQLMFDESARLMFGSRGPLWYRGFHYAMDDDYPMSTTQSIDSIINYFGVSAIVVGHTGVDSVISLFDNRVYAIDVPYEDIFSLEALLWEGGRFYRITGSGEKKSLE